MSPRSSTRPRRSSSPTRRTSRWSATRSATPAALSGAFNAGGTITFELYGPDDANCTGAVIFTDTSTVSGNGSYATAPDFTTSAVGTYRG